MFVLLEYCYYCRYNNHFHGTVPWCFCCKEGILAWGGKGEEYRPDRCTHSPDDGCEWCCSTCNYDRHLCPGCGTVTDHKETACPECEERVENEEIESAARAFINACGLTPTPDATQQLAYAFLPCLRIMIERGYDPTGRTWREGGWRGLLYEMRKKVNRMWHRTWLHGQMDSDSPYDLINYAGFFIRLNCEGPSWGVQGEPGDDGVSAVSMGDYSQLTENGGQVGSGQTLSTNVPPVGAVRTVLGNASRFRHEHPADLACNTGCPAFGAGPPA